MVERQKAEDRKRRFEQVQKKKVTAERIIETLEKNERCYQRVVRIVAGVVFKAVYTKAIDPKCKGPHKLQVSTILGLQERYQTFGCSNAEQVDALAKPISLSLLKFYL